VIPSNTVTGFLWRAGEPVAKVVVKKVETVNKETKTASTKTTIYGAFQFWALSRKVTLTSEVPAAK